MNDNTILSLQVLSSKKFSRDKLKNFLSTDKRKFETDIQKLIKLNKAAFVFLGISARGVYGDNKYYLQLDSSKYSGIIPIRSACNGLIGGYIKIIGRYGEDIDGILPLLCDDNFSPEFDESISINFNLSVSPPKYIECAKYIDFYQQAERFKWQKFSNKTNIQNKPRNTDWVKYSIESTNPANTFRYPNKINFLTLDHPQWKELQYVLDIAIEELTSIKTPILLRRQYAMTIKRLSKGYDKSKLKKTDKISITSSDPVVIKDLKNMANLILSDKTDKKCAWRMDYSTFFERYIQYLFDVLAKKCGARVISNPHYNINGLKPVWSLNYLEPDLVFIKDGSQVIIDAKYKSHMYNLDIKTDNLSNTFRADLHQVLAYSSFNTMTSKKIILAYPFFKFKCFSPKISSNLNEYESTVLLLGIPIVKKEIPKLIDELYEII